MLLRSSVGCRPPGFLTYALESFMHFIHVLLIRDAAVVVALQLHLGNKNQSHGKSDSERCDFDKGSLALSEDIHCDVFCYSFLILYTGFSLAARQL